MITDYVIYFAQIDPYHVFLTLDCIKWSNMPVFLRLSRKISRENITLQNFPELMPISRDNITWLKLPWIYIHITWKFHVINVFESYQYHVKISRDLICLSWDLYHMKISRDDGHALSSWQYRIPEKVLIPGCAQVIRMARMSEPIKSNYMTRKPMSTFRREPISEFRG